MTEIILAAILAGEEIRKTQSFKYTDAIHSKINDYYEITKARGLVNKSIKKENTADVVLYNGSNFLENLKNEDNKVQPSEKNKYKIQIKNEDGKILNEFVQISLKAGGRIGDISAFTTISNNHKYMYHTTESTGSQEISFDESFSFKGLLGILNKFRNFVFKVSKKVKEKILSVKDFLFAKLKHIDTFAQRANKKLLKELLNEDYSFAGIDEARMSLPSEKELFDKFSDKRRYANLAKKVNSGIKELKKELNKFGDNAIYQIPEAIAVPSTPPSSPKEMRYIYYNAVSVLTLLEYLHSIEEVKDFSKVEIDMIYGNTTLPLIKVYADPEHYIEFLATDPNANLDNFKNNYPIFGLKINQSGDHLSFYLYLLSITKTNEVAYIKIQMRTKQEKQYVVDGQSIITYQKFLKEIQSSK